MPPTLYLIDGHALAYRTFFALTAGGSTRLSTSTGEPTAGVFGFASVLLRLCEQDKPEYLAVTFDGGHSFRDEEFAGYKATRAKMPDDLRVQMSRIRDLVDAFGIPRLELDGYEADDILGSIARQAVAAGLWGQDHHRRPRPAAAGGRARGRQPGRQQAQRSQGLHGE